MDLVLKTGLIIFTTIIVSIDTIWIGQRVSDDSVTEYTQAALLLFTSIVFLSAARKTPESRGFLSLIHI